MPLKHKMECRNRGSDACGQSRALRTSRVRMDMGDMGDMDMVYMDMV